MPAGDGQFVELLAERLQDLQEYLAVEHGKALWNLQCRLAELEGHPEPPRTVVPTAPDASPVIFFSPSGQEGEEQVDRLMAENVRLRKELTESSRTSMKMPSSSGRCRVLGSVTEAPEEWAHNLGALPTHCESCGNVFMADAAFCRKCGAQRYHVEEERETAVQFDFGGGADGRRGSDGVVSEADCQSELIINLDKRLLERDGKASSEVKTCETHADRPKPFLQAGTVLRGEDEGKQACSRRTSTVAQVLPSGMANMAALETAMNNAFSDKMHSVSNGIIGTRTKLSAHQEKKPLFRVSDPSNGVKAAPTFQLLDVWEQQNREAKKNTRSMLARTSQGEEEEIFEFDPEDDNDGAVSCQTRLMASPGSQRHLCWELVGIFLIAYDCVALPLETFEPPKTTFTDLFSWIVRVFWTSNIAMSCFIGYIDKKGEVVMRPGDVQRHYARTWLLFDILVVGFDWAEVVMDADSRTAVSGLSAIRAVKMFRLTRLLRLVKARQLEDFIVRNARNEFLVLIAPILKCMIFLLGVTHFIACTWYAVGRHSTNRNNWLRHHGLDDSPLSERYVWSFHFALAMFTGEHVVYPQNNLERTVVVVVLCLTFLISAYFVSSITTAMTRLLIVAGQRLAHSTRALMPP